MANIEATLLRADCALARSTFTKSNPHSKPVGTREATLLRTDLLLARSSIIKAWDSSQHPRDNWGRFEQKGGVAGERYPFGPAQGQQAAQAKLDTALKTKELLLGSGSLEDDQLVTDISGTINDLQVEIDRLDIARVNALRSQRDPQGRPYVHGQTVRDTRSEAQRIQDAHRAQAGQTKTDQEGLQLYDSDKVPSRTRQVITDVAGKIAGTVKTLALLADVVMAYKGDNIKSDTTLAQAARTLSSLNTAATNVQYGARAKNFETLVLQVRGASGAARKLKNEIPTLLDNQIPGVKTSLENAGAQLATVGVKLGELNTRTRAAAGTAVSRAPETARNVVERAKLVLSGGKIKPVTSSRVTAFNLKPSSRSATDYGASTNRGARVEPSRTTSVVPRPKMTTLVART